MSGRTTFYQLIGSHGWIEIPVIQRDYAQGREDQHIVRDDFLKALHDALCMPVDAPSLPLDLDFVYGSVVNDSFQPLDGQQRLTTLFLLHWYLAWSEGKGEDFRAHVLEAGLSRFGYEVRPGSRDFFNRLANFQPDIAVADCQCLVSMITDQPWYFSELALRSHYSLRLVNAGTVARGFSPHIWSIRTANRRSSTGDYFPAS